MSCPQTTHVHRLHDGELSAGERDAVMSHIEVCADCRALLSELGSLSARFRSAPSVGIPNLSLARVKRAWRDNRERGVLRIAEWFTAAAAAVLIGALLMGPLEQSQTSAAPVWQTVAVTPPSEEQPQELVVAQWMADDLSTTDRGEIQ